MIQIYYFIGKDKMRKLKAGRQGVNFVLLEVLFILVNHCIYEIFLVMHSCTLPLSPPTLHASTILEDQLASKRH